MTDSAPAPSNDDSRAALLGLFNSIIPDGYRMEAGDATGRARIVNIHTGETVATI